jgi:hypothetical protein
MKNYLELKTLLEKLVADGAVDGGKGLELLEALNTDFNRVLGSWAMHNLKLHTLARAVDSVEMSARVIGKSGFQASVLQKDLDYAIVIAEQAHEVANAKI